MIRSRGDFFIEHQGVDLFDLDRLLIGLRCARSAEMRRTHRASQPPLARRERVR
jgi:hypothetical protein